jgi:hopene-associated glycosyltransferase HpnB
MYFMSLLVAAVLCVVIWAYLWLARGGFWQVERLGAQAAARKEPGLVAVVIPARNEADVIGSCVSSLLQQTCAASVQIFVVDDHSADATAEAARQGAKNSAYAGALTLISAEPLPPGWSGKLWAMHQGVQQALALHPQFLLFTDADIQHAPDSIASLAGIAEKGGYDLVSFMVRLHCRSIAEKLLIPAFVFFFLLLYPPEWIRDPRRRTASAAGGCMLVRPEALARAGGLAGIRHEVIDDCALAAAVKRGGSKVWLGLAPESQSLRAYRSFAGIERTVARTAFNQLQHSAWLLAGTIAGLALLYLLPPALLCSSSLPLAVLGVAALALMFTAYLPMVRFYRLNPFWALGLPISAAFYMFATLHSALKYWSGRGGEWKGRAQDPMR